MVSYMIEIGILLSVLIVVIITFFLLKGIGIPIRNNPFGKDSLGLIEDLTVDETKNEAKNWRLDKIKMVEKRGERVLSVVVGELGTNMTDTVEFALKKGFDVKVVSDNKIVNDSIRERLIKLLETYSKTFEYYILDNRPDDNFLIIGKSNLFIEVPHKWNDEIKTSLGVSNAHNYILDEFYKKFTNIIETSKKLEVDTIKTMPSYSNDEKIKSPCII